MLFSPPNSPVNQLWRHRLCKLKASIFCTPDGMIIELPGGIKDILLGYCVLSKRKGGMTECQSHSMLEKYPQWKQINVSLWALENNDTGLI